jgi:hypothetical protein
MEQIFHARRFLCQLTGNVNQIGLAWHRRVVKWRIALTSRKPQAERPEAARGRRRVINIARISDMKAAALGS